MKKIFKRYLAIIVSAALVLVSVSLPVCAIRGTWDGISWELSGGTLTVTGDSIPDCTQSEFAPWRKFAGEIGSLKLVGVKTVGSYAFAGLSALREADISGAEKIGSYAFSGSSALASVQVPDGALSLGDFAFAECTALASASLPASLASIGEGVFESCPALARITCSGGRYQNSGAAVIDTANIAIVRYPSNAGGAEYTVPSGIVGILAGAFRDCVNLKKVSFADVTAVGEGAFYGCSSLTEVDFGAVRSIGRAAFYGCSSLGSAELPQTLAFVGDNAFTDSSSLARASFGGDAPETFGDGVFDGCAPTFTVIVKASAEGFGSGTLWNGYPIMRHGIYSGAIDGSDITWSIDTAAGVLTLSGSGAMPDFAEASDAPWHEYRRAATSLSVSDGITKIGDNAFRFMPLVSVVLPASVESIGRFAFSGEAQLRSVSAAGVRSVGAGAFYNDGALVICSFPAIAELGAQSFSGAESLRWVMTGGTAPSVGEYAFDGADDVLLLYPRGVDGYGDVGVPSRSYFSGDADSDGRCSVGDAIVVLKVVANWDNISVDEFAADTDLNGAVSITDAINILKYVAGWDIKIGVYRYF